MKKMIKNKISQMTNKKMIKEKKYKEKEIEEEIDSISKFNYK